MDNQCPLPLHRNEETMGGSSAPDLQSPFTDGLQTPLEHHRPHLHTGQRLRKLLRPNGRRLHVAASPEEHLRLTRTLPKIESDDNFDVYVHGSPEHQAAIRELHAHHETQQEILQNKYGSAYKEIKQALEDLDIVAEELQNLSDHGVSLEANFSKFGYDAHIRTRDPDSSASSMTGDRSSTHEKKDWGAERRKGQALKFWKKPIMRQVSEPNESSCWPY